MVPGYGGGIGDEYGGHLDIEQKSKESDQTFFLDDVKPITILNSINALESSSLGLRDRVSNSMEYSHNYFRGRISNFTQHSNNPYSM